VSDVLDIIDEAMAPQSLTPPELRAREHLVTVASRISSAYQEERRALRSVEAARKLLGG